MKRRTRAAEILINAVSSFISGDLELQWLEFTGKYQR
jgi:hypothetical protein